MSLARVESVALERPGPGKDRGERGGDPEKVGDVMYKSTRQPENTNTQEKHEAAGLCVSESRVCLYTAQPANHLPFPCSCLSTLYLTYLSRNCRKDRE